MSTPLPAYVSCSRLSAAICWNGVSWTCTDAISRPHPYRHHPRVEDLPSPPHIRCQGHRTGSHPLLQAVQVHQAIPPAHIPCRARKFATKPFPWTIKKLTQNRARSTSKASRTARSLTVSTSAFSARAARLRAPHTGGTLRSTSALPFCSSPTAGSPTRVTRRSLSARLRSITP